MQILSSHHPEKAFLKAFDTYANDVFAFCYQRTQDRPRALELLQETFERVWIYIAGGNDITDVRTFLLDTAGRCCWAVGAPTHGLVDEETFSGEDAVTGVYVMKVF